MGKYLLKIILFLFVFSIILILNKSRFNYYYGSNEFELKLNDYTKKNAKEKYNTVFFGSSHIYRQIDVKLFDKKTKKLNTNSYNFGLPGCFALEQLYLLENFLKENDNINDVFLELQFPKKTDENNYKTKRAQYYYNFNTTNLLLKIINLKDIESFKYNFYSIILRFFDYQNSFYNKNNILYQEMNNSLINDGYTSLNHAKKYFENNKDLIKRRNAFLKNTKTAKKTIKKNIRKTLNNKVKKYFDYLNKLEHKYDVNFFVVCHPLKHLIKSENYNNIDIVTLNRDDWLILVNDDKYYFDKGHLSKIGAEYFTSEISKKYINLKK